VAQVARELGVHAGERDGLGRRIRERLALERDGTRGLEPVARRHGGRAQDLRAGHAGALGGVRHALPQRERVLEVPQRLAVGVDALRLDAGRHRRPERPRQVVRRAPVAGELGGHARRGEIAEQRRVALDRLAQRRVQRGPLARQQVLVDRLADERVAERIGAVGVRDQQLVRDSLAGALEQLGGGERAGGLQQRVTHRLLDDGGDPHDLLGGGGQALEAPEQRVAQRRRELACAVGGRGEQLLGVERVALGAGVEAVGQLVVGRAVEDAGELLGHLVAAEALERDPLHARHALELGQHRPQRVAAVQLVGAVGDDQAERLGARAAHEEDEEVARGGIRPVQVLEHERDRLLAAEPIEQGQKPLEDVGLAV